MPARLIGPRRLGGSFYKKRPLVKKPRVSKTASKAIARVVRRVVHVETKHASGTVVDAAFNSSIDTASECYSVIPQVSLGDSDWQRNGAKISNGYLVIKGTIQYEPGSMIPSGTQLYPATVRLMVLEQKNQKDSSLIGSRTSVDSLLDARVSTDVPSKYTGAFPSNESPINTDLFKVFSDKQYRFKWDYQGNFGTAGAAAGTNNTKSFTIRIKCPATLSYDTTTGSPNQPVNFAPFLCLGYTYDSSSTPDVLSRAFRVRVLSTLYFKDA